MAKMKTQEINGEQYIRASDVYKMLEQEGLKLLNKFVPKEKEVKSIKKAETPQQHTQT